MMSCLMGDTLAGVRPHTAASTDRAAYRALLLGQWFRGEVGLETVKESMVGYVREVQETGVRMGNRSQFDSLKAGWK
jgi:hypothetical protein